MNARVWTRRGALAAVALALVATTAWFGVNHTRWMGPALADALRVPFGPRLVSRLEDAGYAVQDRIDRWRYVPPFAGVGAPGDGEWAPIGMKEDASGAPRLFKTVVHPDPRRGYAALAVVAIDRATFALHLVAGTREPESREVAASERRGLIPSEHRADLVAAFNGGFKAIHGRFGLAIGGREFLPPRDGACTILGHADGRVTIGAWDAATAPSVASLRFLRQAPPCLVAEGRIHDRLDSEEYARDWGSTVSGDTVIRRSAIGISEDGATLYFGMGDSLTAQSLARGMLAAGSHAAAALDVNHAFPRFLVYRRGPSGDLEVESSLVNGVEFERDEYLRPSARDFFYVTRARAR